MLQQDGLSERSSVTVNQLHRPSMQQTRARRGHDAPAGDGGMLDGTRVVGPQQQRDGAAGLGGELQSAGFDACQTLDRRDHADDRRTT